MTGEARLTPGALAYRAALLLALAVLVVSLDRFNIKANVPEKFCLAGAILLLMARSYVDGVCLACLGLIVLATLTSATLGTYPDFSWNLYARGLLSLAVAIAPLCLIPREADGRFLLGAIALLPLAFLLMGLVYTAAGLMAFTQVDYLGTPRIGGSTIPAYLGAAGTLGAIAAIFLADRTGRSAWLALVPLDLVLVLLSGGRMAAAAFALTVPVVFYQSFAGRIAQKGLVTIVGLMPLAAVAPWLLAALSKRFTSLSLSGRGVIWEYLSSVADRYPWFGIGLGHQYTIIPDEVERIVHTVAAHNEYLRLRVELGWAGAVPVIALIAAILVWRMLASTTERRLPVLAAILTTAIYCLTDNVLSVPEMFLIPAVTLIGCSRSAIEPEALAQGRAESGADPSCALS